MPKGTQVMSRKLVICDYCGVPAQLVTGTEVYPHRADLASKHFYLCRPCKAWVGCHPGTTDPLGRLADAQLRGWKSRAHATFDPLWKAKKNAEGISKGEARGKGYRWLAKQMGIDPAKCHIGMFGVIECARVVEICEPYSEALRSR
jgi:hypothetical protein